MNLKEVPMGGKAYREKDWEKLSAIEKTERMHSVVRNLQNQINYMSNILENMTKHSHLEDKVVIKLEEIKDHTVPNMINDRKWF